MKLEMSTQLFSDGGLAASRWPSYQHSHWLQPAPASTQSNNLIANASIIAPRQTEDRQEINKIKYIQQKTDAHN